MTEAPPRQQLAQAEYAAAITLIASSQAPQATKSVEIADILLRVAMDAATIPAEAAAKVAKALAELVVVQRVLDRRRDRASERRRANERPESVSPGGVPGVPGVTPGRGERQQPSGEPLRPERAEEDELLKRSFYVVRGTMRMAQSISEGSTPEEALEKESRFFLAHTEAQQRRRSQRRLRAVAMEEYGSNILGWQHRATRDPEVPRDPHERASGLNFDASKGPPKAVGGVWPGELPWCSCAAVAAFPNAVVME